MNQVITETMNHINRLFGPGTIRRGDEYPMQDRFYTGITSLDAAAGGIPRGRIVDIFGAESSGKSTLARLIAKSAGEVLYMDAERGLADTSGLTAMYPELLEDALQAAEVAASAFDAIVIDSITALPTKAEAALDIGDFYTKTTAAAVLSRALPRLAQALQKNCCTLVLVNQLRDIPGVVYGRPERPTGGRALRYYAALRIETQRVETIKHGGICTGQRTRVTVRKNKYGAPFRAADMLLAFGSRRATA